MEDYFSLKPAHLEYLEVCCFQKYGILYITVAYQTRPKCIEVDHSQSVASFPNPNTSEPQSCAESAIISNIRAIHRTKLVVIFLKRKKTDNNSIIIVEPVYIIQDLNR